MTLLDARVAYTTPNDNRHVVHLTFTNAQEAQACVAFFEENAIVGLPENDMCSFFESLVPYGDFLREME